MLIQLPDNDILQHERCQLDIGCRSVRNLELLLRTIIRIECQGVRGSCSKRAYFPSLAGDFRKCELALAARTAVEGESRSRENLDDGECCGALVIDQSLVK